MTFGTRKRYLSRLNGLNWSIACSLDCLSTVFLPMFVNDETNNII